MTFMQLRQIVELNAYVQIRPTFLTDDGATSMNQNL